MGDGAAVRVSYEVRVGAPLGPVLLSAVPHVRAASAGAHATVVVEAVDPDMIADVLRVLLVPGVELEVLRVTADGRLPQLGMS
jgi:hypothetical protein